MRAIIINTRRSPTQEPLGSPIAYQFILQPSTESVRIRSHPLLSSFSLFIQFLYYKSWLFKGLQLTNSLLPHDTSNVITWLERTHFSPSIADRDEETWQRISEDLYPWVRTTAQEFELSRIVDLTTVKEHLEAFKRLRDHVHQQLPQHIMKCREEVSLALKSGSLRLKSKCLGCAILFNYQLPNTIKDGAQD